MATSDLRPLLPDIEALSLEEQVAQMVIVRASGYLFDDQIQYPAWEPSAVKLQHWLQDLGVGGVILLGGSAGEIAWRSQQLQTWAKIPLLIAADIEEGVGQRFSGATWFPPPMAIGAVAHNDVSKAEHYATDMGAYTAQEALAIGLNWIMAPTVDVNNNPNNPVINVRAFGETSLIVSQLATAFIRGAQHYPVLTTAKHFPGHGDTTTDSHLDLPILPHSQARLAEIEIPPFAVAISAGVDTVMSAHLQIPALDPDYPATLSQRILTQELRQRLGFEGLIVTDALVMAAIANRYGPNEAAVLAVEAGSDTLLMPLDPEGAIQAVSEAVKIGRIEPDRIRASVERIWRAKLKVCSPLSDAVSVPHAWENLPPPAVQVDQLSQPAAIATVHNILQDSMHLGIRHRLAPTTNHSDNLRNLIMVDDVLDCILNRQAPAIVLPQKLGYKLQLIDSHTPPALLDLTINNRQPTLLQLFIRSKAFRDIASFTRMAQDWFRTLVKTEQLQALVIYGNLYILDQFLSELPPDVSHVFTYGQMPAAQAIALEALFSSINPTKE